MPVMAAVPSILRKEATRLLRTFWCYQARNNISTTTNSHAIGSRVDIFDRSTKRLQKDRAAELPDNHIYDYLRDEVASTTVDRVCDISRHFPNALDLGCGKGHISKFLTDDIVGTLHQCDLSKKMLDLCHKASVPTIKYQVDEEYLPFEENSFDIVLSSLSLHWVNDLPGTFAQVKRCLKEDGAFIGAMFAGDTLFELRCSLQLAELERKGGFAPRISPFTQMRDMGSLLTRAGFTLTTVDYDEITVDYPSMFELMYDLKGMGENNAAWNRSSYLSRETSIAAAEIYKNHYGNDDGTVPATFQMIHFIGWKPSKDQAKPLARGSANVSFKDLKDINKTEPTKP